MTRVLVVYCHPDPESFTAALRDRTMAALRAGGHDVRLSDLHADDFDPTMSCEERRTHKEPGVAPDLQRYADDLRWAQALVLVYPTWWSGQPAMLKGWIDRVWVRDVAFDLPSESSRVHARLRNVRRITVVTTHGSSKWVNAIEGEAGKRTVTRTLRAVCHPLVRTKWVALYGIDTADERARRAFLDRVARKVVP